MASKSTGQKKKATSKGRKTTKTTTNSKKKKTQTPDLILSNEITLLVTLAVSVLLLISNFGLGGFVGTAVSGFTMLILGWMAYAFPFFLFGGVAFLISNKGNLQAYIKAAATFVLFILFCVFFTLLHDAGGLIGKGISYLLVPAFGKVGTYVVIIMLGLICAVLITERSFLKQLKKGGQKAYGKAKEEHQRYQEQAEARREEREKYQDERRQRRQTAKAEKKKRHERTVSGVSFATTLDAPYPDAPESQAALDFAQAHLEDLDGNHLHSLDSAVASPDIPKEMPMTPFNEPEPFTIHRASSPAAEEEPAFAMEEEPVTAEQIAPSPSRKPEKNPTETAAQTEAIQQQIQQDLERPKPAYRFPPISMLTRGKKGGGDSDAHLKATALKLQQTLKSFGVNVTVNDVSCGPSVTRYELQPETGVKVSKIVGLADDIKLNLAAADIRIEAPIPGKAAVGIEVPNKENSPVMLRDLLESEEFHKAESKISFAVGRDLSGNVVVADIAKMPHLLVAGATGSGKSVCINTLIMSILYKSTPEEVKLIMIDPKVVELSVYNGIPHLMIPVVTDPKKAAGALNWAVAEMTRRYELFAKYNVRDMKGFNAKVESVSQIEDETKPEKMPQIVIIVDELADLMMVAPGDVEESICRLAQLARAAGIHLVLATQRPSVNVITGLIKANMPSRIAFSVSSGVDSRTIIDMNGAEKLLGKGDMLFYPAGVQKPSRVQGSFVSDKEVQSVVEFLVSNNGDTQYNEDVETHMTAAASGSAAGLADSSGNDRDVYFADAGKFIIEKDKASIGMLQRVFKIGFNRAARIMDQLYEAGVVGPEEGTKPRKVLMSMEQFEQYIADYV